MALIPFFFSVDSAHHLSALFTVESNIKLGQSRYHVIVFHCKVSYYSKYYPMISGKECCIRRTKLSKGSTRF